MKHMVRSLITAFALAFGAVSSGWALPKVVSISGVDADGDTYEDGTPFLEGECYAIVWQRAGVEFQGFYSDGSIVDPENCEFIKILAGSQGAVIGMRDGRPYSYCKPYSTSVDATTAVKWANQIALYAFDTRVTVDGKTVVGGKRDDEHLVRINSYVKIMDLQVMTDSGSVKPVEKYRGTVTPTVRSISVEKLIFRTAGDDCFVEGAETNSVATGECYALVWKRTGVEAPELSFVPAAPAAELKGGEDYWLAGYYPAATNDGTKAWCRDVVIEAGTLPIALATNGTWTVYLLDTRDPLAEDACGFDPAVTNAPKLIRAYAPVAGLQDFTLALTDKEDVFADKTATAAAVADRQTEKPTLEITCQGNGGTPKSQTIERSWGEPYGDLSEAVATRAGYGFAGWADGDGQPIDAAAPVWSEATLFAKWTGNRYSVAFDANGGEGEMTDQEFTYGEPQALADNLFTRKGYGFAGWATEEEGEALYLDKAVVSNLTGEADGEFPLYAVWSPNDNTVTFDGNGGTPDEASRTVKTDAELGGLPTATRRGYAFAGWFTDREKGEKVSATTVVTTDVTYYAQWTANEYEIGFDPRGGSGEMDPQPMTWDEEEALYSNLFFRVGYTFLGWTDDKAELDEVQYCDGVVVSNLTDVADGQFPLYAVWEANHYYVAFDANGGEGEMERQEFTYDQPQALTKNGFVNEDYYFAGWATNESDEVVYKNGAEVKNLAADEGAEVTLYAVWSLQAVKTVVPGAKVSFSTADEDVFGTKLIKYTVTGLPDGLKYDKTKGTVSGSVTKANQVGVHQVTFVNGADVREMQIVVEDVPQILVQMCGETEAATNGCKVTGAGSYLVGKKATLKVTVPKATKKAATLFLGWYNDGQPWPNTSTYKKTSVTYTMTEAYTDIRLEARFRVETSEQVEISWTGVGTEGRTFVTGVAGCETGMPVVVSSADGSALSGIKSVKVTSLPSGMKYDAKKGLITGAPTKANEQKTVKIVVTTSAGVEKEMTFDVSTVPMAEAAVGTFNGFVVKDVGGGVWDDAGTFELTVKEDGKLSAKAVTAGKTFSFSGSFWDSVSEDGKYHVVLVTKGKKPDSLTLELDPNRAWNEDQLTGTLSPYDTSAPYGISAQKRAFGTPWNFCCIGGNEADGWTLAYTNVTKGAPLTVTLKADGTTKIAGTLTGTNVVKKKLATYKVSASGYANVSLMTNGAFVADFAPVLTVNGKKCVLSIHTKLWMDRSNAHVKDGIGVGDAKFAE